MQQGTIYITGVIGEDTTLLDVIRQVKAQKNATSYLVKIDSVGGYVEEGEAIYSYLKNLSVLVVTYAIQAYSIASVIFMAGSQRIVTEGAESPLMIHLPWMEVAGSHNEISTHLSDLKNVENRLISFYAEALEIDKNTIQQLLQNETYLSAKQALELGFATTIQQQAKAVAMINNDKEEKEETFMTKLEKKLNQILSKLGAIKAELVLQDATGVELIFPELNEGDSPEAGDVATVDGKKADGEYLLADGSTYIFEGGKLAEIKPAEVEEEAPTDENAVAKNEQIKEICKWSIEVDNTSFEVGDVVIYTYEEVSYPLQAGEYELSLGKRIFTDADGKIIEVKEAEVEEEAPADDSTTAPEARSTENEEKMIEALAMATQKVNELEAKYNALAKSVGSNFQPETKKENNPAIQAKEGERPAFTMKRK